MPPALVATLPPRLALFSPGKTGYTSPCSAVTASSCSRVTPGLHDGDVVGAVDLDDGVHALERDEDTAGPGDARPAQARAAPPGRDGSSQLLGDAQDGGHVVGRSRAHHDGRLDPGGGEGLVVGVVLARRGSGRDVTVADGLDQPLDQLCHRRSPTRVGASLREQGPSDGRCAPGIGFGRARRVPYADRSHGGRSSARLERQVVALEVGGSSPLGHPTSTGRPRRSPGPGGPRRRPIACESHRVGRIPWPTHHAPLAQRQSNGLLIRRFWVRIPGGVPRHRRRPLRGRGLAAAVGG